MATRTSVRQLRPLLVMIGVVLLLWLVLTPPRGGRDAPPAADGEVKHATPTQTQTAAPTPRASTPAAASRPGQTPRSARAGGPPRPSPSTDGSGRGLWEILEEAMRRKDVSDEQRGLDSRERRGTDWTPFDDSPARREG